MVLHGNSKRAGAAAVELAILLPFLALMFSAAVDFGRIFYATQAIDRAANTAALYASGNAWVPTSLTSANDAAVAAACVEGSSLNPPLTSSNVSISTSGTATTATITYSYPLITAVLIPTASLQLKRSITLQTAVTPGS
jgi:Flp pilus assembly protein TadG